MVPRLVSLEGRRSSSWGLMGHGKRWNCLAVGISHRPKLFRWWAVKL